MKTLSKVTGEKLTLKFSPEGALSSARFEGRSITAQVKYVREHDYVKILSTLGFREKWTREEVEMFAPLNELVAGLDLALFNVVDESADYSKVLLCEKNDPEDIHKLPKVVLSFSIQERRSVKIVRIFDTQFERYGKLLDIGR